MQIFLNFIARHPIVTQPSELCQFMSGGLADKKLSPDGYGWYTPFYAPQSTPIGFEKSER